MRNLKLHKKRKEYSRDPSFWSLHSEECDHGHGAVVIVEGLSIPNPHVDLRGRWVVQGKDEVFAPGNKNGQFVNVKIWQF